MSTLKNSLRPLFIVLLFLFAGNSSHAQSITPHYFGQNAWMPDTIGNAAACIQPPCILWGQLHNKWSKIGESGAQTVRFGGIQVDRNMPTNYQYIKMIDSIRAKGMEPIIQVPFYNWRYSAAQAAQIVQYINITKGRNIKYWVIGNEPDHVYGYTSASQVSAYIKPFASAMKAVDPSIKLIGPETAWFNTAIMNGLTTPGGPDDITGLDSAGRFYIDILSFHMYAFNGSQNRSSVITNLMAPGGMNANLAYLNGRISNCNSFHGRSGNNALVTAVTEANINYQNSSLDNLNGNGVNSFIGGQFVAEMFGVGLQNNVNFINMWSVVEGNSNALNIGYIDASTGIKKPAYYHYQLMSQNFSGNYLSSVSTHSNVKAISCKNPSVTTVMIMNQDLTTNYTCTVRLDNAQASGTSALKINVNAAIPQEYTDVIGNQSTVLLQFNNQGALIKKIVYGLSTHAISNLPPSVTSFTPSLPVVSAPVNNTPQNNLSKCTGKTTTLSVASTTSNVSWYSSSTSTTALGTGLSFVTPSLSVAGSSLTFTYYAEAGNGTTVSVRTPVTVTVHPRPVITVAGGTLCAGNSFTINPSGANSYTISGGSFIVSPSVSTTYYVAGTNSLGCTATISGVATITVDQRPVVSVNSGTVCEGATFVLNPSGASSYSYSGNSATVNPAASSSYSVTGYSSKGCASSNIAVAQVSVISAPVVTAGSGSICSGDNFTISPAGASSYTISGNGSFVVNPPASTTYSVYGSNGQCSGTSPAIVTVSVSPRPSVAVTGGSVCAGSTFSLSPSGAATYIFSSGSSTVNPLSTTAYSVSGISADGCSSTNTAIATVSVVAAPSLAVTNGSICSGETYTLAASGAQSYSFSSNSAIVSPAVTSTYTIYGSNAGCLSAPALVTVSVFARPVVAVNSGTICPGTIFTLSPSGAQTYSFSSQAATVAPLQTTQYQVTGISMDGCASANTAVATVSVHTSPVISVNNGSICPGEQVTISPSGASTFSISGGSFVVSPQNSTSYTITGTDAACGLTGTSVAHVTVNSKPTIVVNSGFVCQGSSFNIIPSGAHTYSVQGAAFVVSPLTNTSYVVSGTSAEGCTASAVCQVSVHALPEVKVNSGTICRGKTFTISPSGAASYSYSSGSPVVSPHSTTSYTVTGFMNGCSNTAIAYVTVLKKGIECKTYEASVAPENPVAAAGEATISLTGSSNMYDGSADGQGTLTFIDDKDPQEETFKVFPNPNKGEFSVTIREAAAFDLIDLRGNVVRTLELPAGTTLLNIDDLTAGIYIIRFEQEGRTQFFRVVKQ